MFKSSVDTYPAADLQFLRTGISIGLAGGVAEIGVVWLYAALTGADAGEVARQVGAAVGLAGTSALAGVVVHLVLSVGLGLVLTGLVQAMPLRPMRGASVVGVMVTSLIAVWALNFFVVLPRVSPGFVILLPYAVTLVSKAMFGVAAALCFCIIQRPHRSAAAMRWSGMLSQ